jgi:RluA family pseudouridine synthase
MTIADRTFEHDKYTVVYQVPAALDGSRLDVFVADKFDSLSREFIKRKIKKGEIFIEGRPTPLKPHTLVKGYDKVVMICHREANEEENWRGRPLSIEERPEFVYEDDKIIVISKPPFMAAHPTGRHLYNCATVALERMKGIPFSCCHRLDRETSGLLVMSGHTDSVRDILSQFENGLVRKVYFFIARKGQTPVTKFPFIATESMDKDLSTHLPSVRIFSDDTDEGKKSQTLFELLHAENGYFVGLAFPHTGRLHQIRVHAAHHGFPLVGDKLYNGDPSIFERFKDGLATDADHEAMQMPRHALHSIAINFTYEGARKTFVSHIPLDMKNWLIGNLSCDVEKLEQSIKARIERYFLETT